MIFEEMAFRIFLILFDATILVVLVLVWGYSYSDYIFSRAFLRAGMTNTAGETPILKRIVKTNSQHELYFYSAGITLEEWNDKIELLNNVLKMTISDVKMGRTNQEIILRGIKGLYDWNAEKMYYPMEKEDESVIILGENSAGIVFCDMSIYPHILIGGSTGSGKTYLLKFIMFQLLMKKHQVIIADLKGGIDYSRTFEEKCELILDEETILQRLEEICGELYKRLNILREEGCKDIVEYNARYNSSKMKRIIFCCDEVAQLLDLKGAEKEKKEQIKQITYYFNTIARMGRAVGIHLILATQRPDADIVTGQIKSNISYRICGRADKVLSTIILDVGDAADKVPKNIPGIFLNHDGVLFKSYLYNEDTEC